MSRTDLMALTGEDLVLLANRGVVRRAEREVAAGAELEVAEDEAGTVTVTGADATTTLPAGARLEDSRCTCAAAGLCRHVVRAVLAYQAADNGAASAAVGAADAAWDPGAIGDEVLDAHVPRATRARARTRAKTGVAVSPTRSARPLAQIHDDDVVVRFLVPGDLSYARCSCAQPAPCEHAVLAVLAFRALPDGADAGLVELGSPPPVDARARAEVEDAVALVAEAGVASGRQGTVRVLEHASAHARDAGWAWPAAALDDLAEACRRHAAADPAFAPAEVPRLAGEVLARLDAIAGGTVPRGVVAGGPRRADVEVRGGLLIGLGTRVRRAGATSHIDALMYDTNNARVVAIGRSLADGDGGPMPFARLAAGSVRKGITYADLGRGQLVATGARISAGGRVSLGRRPASSSPQRLDWATSLGGLVAESFAEARALSSHRLPPALAARTPAESFAVVAVEGVQDAGWDPAEHAVVATLHDGAGGTATMVHPYTAPGAAGVEALLAGLDHAAAVRFVAGYLTRSGLRPTAVVVEDDAGQRTMLQPWVDAAGAPATDRSALLDTEPTTVLTELSGALADLLTAGVARPDALTRDRWADLTERLDGAGSTVLLRPVRTLSEALGRSLRAPHDATSDAVDAALKLAVLLAVADGLDTYTDTASSSP
ncbi:SWIM zinc finger family protein [Conexibacter woesei]|uniref:SWIM zinc finger family protein n=1 Tax=Conexibacter woesei TaxID=191495 RepID=UPI0003FCA385|nr:SWIM zinc finger family protein [Conexibacter woesei]